MNRRNVIIVLVTLAGACLPGLQATLAAADCNTNGVDDTLDIAAGTSEDCNTNGVPDECDLVAFELAKLVAADAAASDGFGDSVSINGDTAVIGAPSDSGAVPASGSAYVFVRSGGAWTQQAKLTAADAAAGDYFGISVSLSGDTAVVGAIGDDDAGSGSGTAYVFVRSAGVWTQQTKLTAADATAGDWFGSSVSVSGDTAVVGAVWGDGADPISGSAYVFVRSAGVWTQQAKLTAPGGPSGEQFGYSVAVSGDTAVVGAFYGDDPGLSSGSAYVFVRSAGVWTQQAKLTASDAAPDDRFGPSVAISGDTVVVGAEGDDHGGGTNAGSAYMFVKPPGGWVNMTETAKLTAADGVAGDYFGRGVSLSGDTAVVGAFGDDDAGSASGSAYVFLCNDGAWTQQAKLTAADGAAGDCFGRSVSLSGDTAVVGAYGDDDAGSASGSAYLFTAISKDCNANGTLDECDVSAGTSPDCNTNGVPDECELFGDCDGDGDVDLDDYADFEACLLGPGGGMGPDCDCFDLDSSGDVDLLDFADFAVRLSGSQP